MINIEDASLPVATSKGIADAVLVPAIRLICPPYFHTIVISQVISSQLNWLPSSYSESPSISKVAFHHSW
jgi:hypothetical protein